MPPATGALIHGRVVAQAVVPSSNRVITAYKAQRI